MPRFPVGAASSRSVSSTTVSFMDYSGRRRSINVPHALSATEQERIDMANAIGDASNAAVVSRQTTAGVEVTPSDPDVEVYDETYSSVGTHARLTFQNNDGNIIGVNIPAPDATILLDDRFTVRPDLAAIGAILTVINAGGGSYVYRSGYLTGGKVKGRRPAVMPATIVEPGPTDQPPGGPANGGE
jgi:hypothetical protein